MQTLREIGDLGTLAPPVHLAIGVFDGVHRGHAEVVYGALERARQDGGTAAVLTFDPHPISVLCPEKAPRLLASMPHKAQLLAAFGVGTLLIVHFDRELAATAADVFVRHLAKAAGNLGSISVGHSWSFGRGRKGNLSLLNQLGDELGFVVNGVPPVCDAAGVAISSTRIREAVERGDFGAAEALLGRDYKVLGTVVAGRNLGRQIGFPTANLAVHSEQLPPSGVYSIKAGLDGAVHRGVANLGTRPTVASASARRRQLEVHLFEFDADIYDHELEVQFLDFIRPEQKFANLDALKEQIARDVAAAR